MNRGEKGFHPRQVRLDGFPEGESVCGLEENLRDENVAASVMVDPFYGLIGVGRGAGFCPTNGPERMRQRVGRSGLGIHDQNFHGASCLR